MIQEQLVDYISSQIKLGVSQDAIKATLTGAGWAIADVEDTFKKINETGAMAKPAASSSAEISFSASIPTVAAKTPAKAGEPQTIRVSDLVSASSASAVSAAASAQPKISPLSQGTVSSSKTTTTQTVTTSNKKTGGTFPVMTVVWIVLVIIFAGLAGYFFFENMSLSSRVGTANTQSQDITSQISSLQTQVKAFTASSTGMAAQIASLGESNGQLQTELSFFVVPSSGATTTDVSLNGIVSGGKPTFILTTSDGVKVSIKNSADVSVRSALQAFASSSQQVQITGTYVPGTAVIIALSANGTSLYAAPTSTATTTASDTTTSAPLGTSTAVGSASTGTPSGLSSSTSNK